MQLKLPAYFWVQKSSFHEVEAKLKIPYPDFVVRLLMYVNWAVWINHFANFQKIGMLVKELRCLFTRLRFQQKINFGSDSHVRKFLIRSASIQWLRSSFYILKLCSRSEANLSSGQTLIRSKFCQRDQWILSSGQTLLHLKLDQRGQSIQNSGQTLMRLKFGSAG